jgi:hypothetical protein
MSVLNEYRVFCITENQFVTGYLEDGKSCTSCFNNNTHTINQNSISIINTITQNTTIISTQAPNQTNGNFRREGKILTALPNTVTKQTTNFNYPIGMLAFNVDYNVSNQGDMFEAIIMPINQSPIGILNQELVSGQTIIHINPESLVLLKTGFNLVLQNSTTGIIEEESEIISIDPIASTITLVSGIVSSFKTGDYISFLMKRCKSVYINTTGSYSIGNFLRSSLFPTQLQAQIRYTNNSSTTKSFSYSIDYLF